MTVPGKTDHSILIPHCSAHFAVHNGAVRFVIAYTVPKLRDPKYEYPRNEF